MEPRLNLLRLTRNEDFMSRKRKRYGYAIIAILAVGVLVPSMWNLAWGVPGKVDFQLHHAYYDQLVREAKRLPQPPEAKIGHFAKGSTKVYYARSPANAHTVTLVTADWGHAGMAGYLYCDQVPTPTVGDPYSNVEAPGDLWMLGEQVAPHWWIISNHLN
jgi:hypothetical protein